MCETRAYPPTVETTPSALTPTAVHVLTLRWRRSAKPSSPYPAMAPVACVTEHVFDPEKPTVPDPPSWHGFADVASAMHWNITTLGAKPERWVNASMLGDE
jgi:hypothetical protein